MGGTNNRAIAAEADDEVGVGDLPIGNLGQTGKACRLLVAANLDALGAKPLRRLNHGGDRVGAVPVRDDVNAQR